MIAAILQWNVQWMDPDHNLKYIADQVGMIQGKIDLLVLPEMFNVGYTMHPDQLDPSIQANTINPLITIAKENQILIIGSLPMVRDGKYYNTLLSIGPEGIISSYDKIHLFGMAGENKMYTAGHSNQIYTYNDWRIQTLVCYDLRFPYASYNHSDKDIIIYSANWPIKRIHHWRQLLIARAIENQCYVIGVNRLGSDANGYDYNGQSMIIDYNGEIIIDAFDATDIQIGHLDLDRLKQFREGLPFLGDRVM
jgi:omega-amidase